MIGLDRVPSNRSLPDQKAIPMSTREVAAPARPAQSKTTDTAAVERPIPSGTNTAGFGSDVVAEVLRDLDIPYIALNPGAS